MMRLATVSTNWWSWEAKSSDLGESDQAVVEGGDRLEVEVVGRLVEDHARWRRSSIIRESMQRTLSPPERTLRLLGRLVAGEEHPAEKAADEPLACLLAELPQPVDQGELLAK